MNQGMAVIDPNLDPASSGLIPRGPDGDDDHLRQVILGFRADSRARGSTLPGFARTLYRGGTVEQRELVDEHERLHVELNRCTSFGLLLEVCGDQVRRNKSNFERLERLLEISRTTHETYATCISAAKLTANERETFFRQFYPDYLEYLDNGNRLRRQFPLSSIVGGGAITAACVAAMYVPIGLGPLGSIAMRGVEASVPPEHRPDWRLQYLLSSSPVDFSWLGGYSVAAGHERERVPQFIQPREKELYHRVLIGFFLHYAAKLTEAGCPVLDWDRHLRYRTEDDLVGDVQAGSFHDGAPSLARVEKLALATDHASTPDNAMRAAESYALHGSLYNAEAAARSAQSVFDNAALSTLVRRWPVQTIHVIVRPLDCLLESTRFSFADESYLRGHAVDGVVTALRTSVDIDGKRTLAIFMLESPGDLRRLLTYKLPLVDGQLPRLVTSISTSCLFSAAWCAKWLTALRLATVPVQHVDVPLTIFLKGVVGDPDGYSFWTTKLMPTPGADVDTLYAVGILRNRAQHTVDEHIAIVGSHSVVSHVVNALRGGLGIQLDLPVRSPQFLAALDVAENEPELHFHGLQHRTTADLRNPPSTAVEEQGWRNLAALRILGNSPAL